MTYGITLVLHKFRASLMALRLLLRRMRSPDLLANRSLKKYFLLVFLIHGLFRLFWRFLQNKINSKKMNTILTR